MNRATVMALVLGVHALFVLLMLAGNPMTARRPAQAPEQSGVWIRLEPLPPPAQETPSRDESTAPPATAPARDPAASRPLPRTAITVPPSLPSPAEPQVAESTARPPVDWHSEGTRVAAEIVADKPTSIGKPLVPLREPCKPRVSSLWGKPQSPAQPPPTWQNQVEPAAEVLTGVTRHTIKGGISIPLGKREPRDDLFDDMLAGATPRSSVPDPHTCD